MYHWWLHRLSAVLMIPLVVWMMFIVFNLSNTNYNEAVKLVQNPFNTIVLILFISIGFWHVSMGLQVVLEDYIAIKSLRTKLIFSMKLLTFILSAIVNICILSIFF